LSTGPGRGEGRYERPEDQDAPVVPPVEQPRRSAEEQCRAKSETENVYYT